MREKEKSPMEKSVEYGACIAQELKHWKELHDGTQPCIDPFWEEGGNMNLIRNHILRYRELIEKELPPVLYPKEYNLPVPEEYPIRYIGGLDTLIERAKAALQKVKGMKSYLELIQCGYVETISEKQKQHDNIFYNVVLGYVKNLECAIPAAEELIKTYDPNNNAQRNESIMDVRRYANYSDSWWESAFEGCLRKIHATYPKLQPVVSHTENTSAGVDPNPTDSIKTVTTTSTDKINPFESERIHQLSFFELGLI